MRVLTGTLRKRRDLGDILGHSFAFFGADWQGFVTIGAGTIPASVAGTLIPALFDDLLFRFSLTAALFLISIGIYAVVEAAVVSHLLALDSGAAANEAAAFRNAFARLADLLGATYRSFLIVLVLAFTVLGLVFAVDRAIRWLFVPQAVMIDGQTRKTALAFSAGLVRGHWWRTFGRVLFIGFLVGILTASITSVAVTAPLLLYALLSAILGAFTGPYFSIALTLAYCDLKLRQLQDSL